MGHQDQPVAGHPPVPQTTLFAGLRRNAAMINDNSKGKLCTPRGSSGATSRFWALSSRTFVVRGSPHPSDRRCGRGAGPGRLWRLSVRRARPGQDTAPPAPNIPATAQPAAGHPRGDGGLEPGTPARWSWMIVSSARRAGRTKTPRLGVLRAGARAACRQWRSGLHKTVVTGFFAAESRAILKGVDVDLAKPRLRPSRAAAAPARRRHRRVALGLDAVPSAGSVTLGVSGLDRVGYLPEPGPLRLPFGA